MSVDDGLPPAGGRRDSQARSLMRPGWSRRGKQVALRFALLLGAYLAWGALALLLITTTGNSSVSGTSIDGHVTQVAQPATTIYQSDPRPVQAILVGLAGALLISTASVVWRVVRRSTRVGVTGMIVAGLAGVVAVLGMLTIGMFILPVAVLLVVLALPIAPERRPVLPPPVGPPGWYGDPAGGTSWRYWNGSAWTDEFAPSVRG